MGSGLSIRILTGLFCTRFNATSSQLEIRVTTLPSASKPIMPAPGSCTGSSHLTFVYIRIILICSGLQLVTLNGILTCKFQASYLNYYWTFFVCESSGLAVVMAEDIPGLATINPPSKPLRKLRRKKYADGVYSAAWDQLCPTFDKLSANELWSDVLLLVIYIIYTLCIDGLALTESG